MNCNYSVASSSSFPLDEARPQQEYRLLFKKISLVFFASLLAGSVATLVLCHLNYIVVCKSYFFYGACGVGGFSAAAFILSMFIKRSFSKVFHLDNSEIFKKQFASAYRKLVGNRYEKIAPVGLNQGQAALYFNNGEGSIHSFKFEECQGKVLVITYSLDEQVDNFIMVGNFSGPLVAPEPRSQEYALRGHHHASMSYKEFQRLCKYGWFPLRIQLMMLGLKNGDKLH